MNRVFILGGTGHIGTKLVKNLTANQVPVTLYVRNPDKVKVTFSNLDLIETVQGDYEDLTQLKESLKGHTRLFLLISGFDQFVELMGTAAHYAYAAGIKQIVSISSSTVNYGWRNSFIGTQHYLAEKAIFELSQQYHAHFVALRASFFMTNLFWMSRPAQDGFVYDDVPADDTQEWISYNDIAAVAAIVLQDEIQKHGNSCYSLTGDVVTVAERAAIISRVLGQHIPYKQMTSVEKYNKMIQDGMPHGIALDFSDNFKINKDKRVNPVIEILTGREPETLEAFLTAHKHCLV
ncbi:hypothetical protein BD560DRAFT_392893 [Blakeslea trispora]|nr:hypothetical protein BD560DRAFT_392893 [Blakeslea trispora]